MKIAASKKQKARRTVVGFQVVEDKCIWMKAGVVNFRLCDNAYDCYNCPFDKGMRKAMGMAPHVDNREEAPKWVTYLKEKYDGANRPCRHALTGRIDAPKICTWNYECYHCAFDQMLDEVDFEQTPTAPEILVASGYRMADGYYYHMGHSWARFEHGGRVRVGMDDFFGKLFGPIQSLALPPLGERVKQNAVSWTFSRGDQSAAVLAPVSGQVLAVNTGAREHPEIAHEDPYQEGWLFIVEPDFPKRNLKQLYFGKESIHWIDAESQRLMGLMGPEYQQLAATGGEPISDIYGSFPEIGWDTLVGEFLRTETRGERR